MRHRVPTDVSPYAADAADRAFDVLVDVMDGKVKRDAFVRLMGAKAVREDVCGPVPKQVAITGAKGEPLSIQINFKPRDAAKPEGGSLPIPEGDSNG